MAVSLSKGINVEVFRTTPEESAKNHADAQHRQAIRTVAREVKELRIAEDKVKELRIAQDKMKRVSLAKEPYVKDGRPSRDQCTKTGALLLHLQATLTPVDLVKSSRLAAPALLDLCGLTRGDLESVSPIDWDAEPEARQAALAKALHVLISTLYSADPCSEQDFRRIVLDVVTSLRAELLDAHRRWWHVDDVALAFADRLWEPAPDSRLVLAARFASDAITMIVALFCAIVALPLIASGMTDRRRLRTASEGVRTIASAQPRDLLPANAFCALDDMATVADLERARALLKRHVAGNPADTDDTVRIERHLSDFAERIASAQRDGALTDELRRESIKALRALIRSMDEISSRASRLAAQALETEIRFIVSAHGTPDETLALTSDRMVA